MLTDTDYTMDELVKAMQVTQQMQSMFGVMQGQGPGPMQQQGGGMYNGNQYQRNGGPGWRPYNGHGGDSYSRGSRGTYQRNYGNNDSRPPGLHDKVDSLTKVVESLTNVVQGAAHNTTASAGVAQPPLGFGILIVAFQAYILIAYCRVLGIYRTIYRDIWSL